MNANYVSLARKNLVQRGFTLVEILIVVIILGILAAIVVPQFSNASLVAKENVMKEDLRFMREQIAYFTYQHQDTPPGHAGGITGNAATDTDFFSQMTNHTDITADVSATADSTHVYGPYISKIPNNPINGKNTILVVAAGSVPAAASDGYGWVYEPSTRTFRSDAVGTDTSGMNYYDY